jgi:trigger factor
MKVYYEQFAAMYGMTLDDFVSGMGVSNFDELVEEYREELTSSARTSLIYQAIAEDKGMTITEDDVTEEFSDMDESSVKDIQDYYGMPYIKYVLLNSKVAQLIRDSAIIE